MARKVTTYLTSDLSGSDADETIKFSIDGRFYRIDLTEDEAKEFREHLTTYTAKGEHIAKEDAIKSPSTRGSSRERQERADIRAWATENGYEIGDRGRISTKIREAYSRAHS